MRTISLFATALLALFSVLGSVLHAAESAADKSAEPQLRVESGMHIAVVRHIVVSADGRTIVSSSFDKTIRIWSAPDGKLQKVLRVPIGEGFGGSLFAVALSPDGKTIAAGGWTNQNYDVYLLDVASGRIVKSLGPNPDVTNNLAFSPDGHDLVAVFGAGRGMRMFDVDTGAQIAEDKNYTDDAYGLAFRNNGTFATSAYDGMVRLYAQDGSLLSQLNAPSGQKAFSVAFTPDGSKLAVGYNDIPTVDIFSMNDYEWLPKPDLTGVTGGDLDAVTWSADGSTLYAGGAFRDQLGWYAVLRWPDQGKGQMSVAYQAADAVFDMEPYGQDGVAIDDALPALTIIKGNQKLMELLPPIAGMGRGEKGILTADPTGRKVRFSLDSAGKQPVIFDLDTLELKDAVGTPDTFPAADTESLKVTDWNGKAGTKLGDTVLPIDSHETTYSLAIAPDKSNLILGTGWYVRKYDAQGKFLWRTAVTGVAWGVTYAQNGKVVIAALGDGTVRWFRTEDGKEILSLFVHKDSKRWVLWSPGGYYAASAGGEDLIGWNVNRSATEAPDFFSAARFRATFYRPDVVQKITQVLHEEQAIKEANAAAGRQDEKPQEGVRGILPAVVELAMDSDELKTATSPVEISYRVRSPSGEPIEAMEVLVNGRPLEGRGAIAIPDENEVSTIDVPIPPQNSEIGLIAHTKTGASEVKIIKVKWDGAFAEILKPKLYAVVVGVSNYDSGDLKLKYAAKDASDFAADLQKQEGGLYGKVNVKLLTNDKATRDDIVAALEWLEHEVTSRDVGLVFMAGHGVTDNKQRFYFLPVDANMDKLRATAVSRDDLLDTMGGLAGKALMFIDACHSATSTKPGELARGAPADITEVVNELSSAENGIVMFASSTGRQVSIESDAWQHGAFTQALIEGLSGAADYQHNGRVTIAGLDEWLSSRVKELTDGRQSPVMRMPDTIPNFPIALVR